MQPLRSIRSTMQTFERCSACGRQVQLLWSVDDSGMPLRHAGPGDHVSEVMTVGPDDQVWSGRPEGARIVRISTQCRFERCSGYVRAFIDVGAAFLDGRQGCQNDNVTAIEGDRFAVLRDG